MMINCLQCNKIVCCLILAFSFFLMCDLTDACRSRFSILRPRSPVTTIRPRPSYQRFETHKCPPDYAAWYCLNNSTCFAVKIGAEEQEWLFNCECRDSFIGPRCDYKYVDITIVNNHNRILLETASFTQGALAALVVFFIIGVLVFLKTQSKR